MALLKIFNGEQFIPIKTLSYFNKPQLLTLMNSEQNAFVDMAFTRKLVVLAARGCFTEPNASH